MNREIKFRAKSLNYGTWEYGDLNTLFSIHPYIYTESRKIVVEESTVGQFTGLHDKNGKEIYEGDIVKCDGKNYVVKFKNGMFYASVEECNKGIYGGFPLYFILDRYEECDVIGNVTDDPELLKGGEK